jgi:mannosyltransferase
VRPAKVAAAVPAAVIPAILAAAVTTTEVGRPELWRDELATWSAASRPLPQLWRLLHHTDAVLGPYYMAEHVWMSGFGDSATAMRLPSALAVTLTAAVVALIARRLVAGFDAEHANVAALAAGVIFAFIPAVTRYGQEARPYAFAALFSALATLALLAIAGRRTWYRRAGYALALAAAGAASLVTLSVLAGHVIGAVALRGSRGWRPGPATRARGLTRVLPVAAFAACAVAAAALNYPLILAGRQQASSQLDNLTRPGWTALWTLWPQLFSSGPAAVVVLALAAAGLIAGPAAYRRACGFAVAVALVPVLAVWVVSHGTVSYWTTRYFIFTLPAWAAAAGTGVAAVTARARSLAVRYGIVARYGAAAVLAALPLAAGATAQVAVRQPQAHNWWTYPAPSGDIPLGYAQAADIIAAHEQAHDGIAFQISDDNRWEVDKGVLYYLGDRRAPRTVFEAQTEEQAGLLTPVECTHPAGCLHGTRRVWVVYINHLVRQGLGGTPFQALPPAATAALHAGGYRVEQTYHADGIIVSLLVPAAYRE